MLSFGAPAAAIPMRQADTLFSLIAEASEPDLSAFAPAREQLGTLNACVTPLDKLACVRKTVALIRHAAMQHIVSTQGADGGAAAAVTSSSKNRLFANGDNTAGPQAIAAKAVPAVLAWALTTLPGLGVHANLAFLRRWTPDAADFTANGQFALLCFWLLCGLQIQLLYPPYRGSCSCTHHACTHDRLRGGLRVGAGGVRVGGTRVGGP